MTKSQVIVRWAARILDFYGHKELAEQLRCVSLPAVERNSGFYAGSWELHEPFRLAVSRNLQVFDPEYVMEWANSRPKVPGTFYVVLTYPITVHFEFARLEI